MRKNMLSFRNILKPVDLSISVLDRAINSSIADFEEAVHYFTAVYSDADYIITRNVTIPRFQAIGPTFLLKNVGIRLRSYRNRFAGS